MNDYYLSVFTQLCVVVHTLGFLKLTESCSHFLSVTADMLHVYMCTYVP